MVKYSFIIPVKIINNYIRDLVPRVVSLSPGNFEILIYPDEELDERWEKTRQVATGPVGPAEKRNLALRDAQGEVLIFIDDDAYPKDDFLEILEKDFADPEVVAVGGPALTPHESKFWQKVSGAMFLSNLSGGFPERYRPVGKKKIIYDWPTVNLSIRKSVFAELGGFSRSYWPGDDTFLCYELMTKKKAGVLYDPELIVYHHRREGLLKHIRQVSAYGLHRGYFAKKFSKTSRNWRYFMPSGLVLFIAVGAVASFFSPIYLKLYLIGWVIYLFALLKAFFDIQRHEKNFLVTLAASYYIFLSHIFYGLRFLQGFFLTRELKSKLRQ